MRKVYTIIFLVLLTVTKINAGDNFRLRLGIGDIGLGLNYSLNNPFLYEVNASVINIAVEHIDTKIGFELSPLKYFLWSYNDDMTEKNEKLSFLNLKTYWNMLPKNDLILGPFLSINYLFYNNWNSMNYKDLVFNTGISFAYTIKMNNSDIYYKLIGSEIGYRNISGNNCLYFNINVDIITAMYGIASGYSGNNYKKAQTAHKRLSDKL
jgi:hypothetical protein